MSSCTIAGALCGGILRRHAACLRYSAGADPGVVHRDAFTAQTSLMSVMLSTRHGTKGMLSRMRCFSVLVVAHAAAGVHPMSKRNGSCPSPVAVRVTARIDMRADDCLG